MPDDEARVRPWRDWRVDTYRVEFADTVADDGTAIVGFAWDHAKQAARLWCYRCRSWRCGHVQVVERHRERYER